MNNREAVKLRPGMLIRRTVSDADRAAATEGATFIVERVEPPTRRYDATVYASGQVFPPWEIERVLHRDKQKTT